MNYQQFSHRGQQGFPQHYGHQHHTQVSHVPHNETVGGGKRSRDLSPSPSSEGSWQQSFKRLKVMSGDEQDVTPSSSWQPPQQAITPAAPPSSAYDHQQQHQMAGQHSSEAAQQQQHPHTQQNADYQSMNSLLGSLHMMRRRQQHRSGEAACHSVEQQQQQPYAMKNASQRARQSNEPHHTRKRVANLRISSNLY